MSGIDEQILDVPLCPKCGKQSNYWIGDFRRGQCWLLSDRYMNKHDIYGTHVIYESSFKNNLQNLDTVETFRCHCSHTLYGPDADIYRRILYNMEAFREKEGITFNSGGTAR